MKINEQIVLIKQMENTMSHQIEQLSRAQKENAKLKTTLVQLQLNQQINESDSQQIQELNRINLNLQKQIKMVEQENQLLK
jgi:hypothetical protein